MWFHSVRLSKRSFLSIWVRSTFISSICHLKKIKSENKYCDIEVFRISLVSHSLLFLFELEIYREANQIVCGLIKNKNAWDLIKEMNAKDFGPTRQCDFNAKSLWRRRRWYVVLRKLWKRSADKLYKCTENYRFRRRKTKTRTGCLYIYIIKP